jgi:phosphatidylglycerol:prolipoprotein diacylglycerol transferase
MYPELFEIPFVHVTIKTYGVLMVVGFLLSVLLMRRMMRRIGQDPELITNTALYALIAGVVGSRVFYVFHHLPQFRGNWKNVFAVWEGGLEFLGGVLLAILVMIAYLYIQKLPLRRYFDVLAVGLMVGLGFGRIGCLMFGCCFGKPCDLPWAIRFPYASPSFYSQVYPDPERNRLKPYWDLPVEYFGYLSDDGKTWIPVEQESMKFRAGLKPKRFLTDSQKVEVAQGLYLAHRIHPTQIYGSLKAFTICLLLYGFWRKFGNRKPGATVSLLMILYGAARFFLEFLRDDNRFEYFNGESNWWMIYSGGTISQNIGVYLVIIGSILLIYHLMRRPGPVQARRKSKS